MTKNDLYEEDEPIEKILDFWESPKGYTERPGDNPLVKVRPGVWVRADQAWRWANA